MRIISIDITNFGKLHNYHMDFNDSMNTICESNGYGKTTIGAFIKVMFYGFHGESKKAKADRERIKYLPWNGKTCGGSIDFIVNEKRYLLERTFGEKASQDTVSLIDYNTKSPTSDYDLNHLGKELFDIDSESFARTLLLSQNEYRENIKDNSTNDIDTKIGNLVAFSNDMNNFGIAEKTLNDKKLEIKSVKKKGKYDLNQKEIDQLSTEVSRLPFVEKAIQDQEKKLIGLNSQKAEKEEEIRKQNYIQMMLTSQKEYRSILDSFEQSKKTHDETVQYFKQIPSPNLIEKYIQLSKDIYKYNTIIEENTLSKEEQLKLDSYHQTFEGTSFDPDIEQTITEFNDASRFINKLDLTEDERIQLAKESVFFKNGLDIKKISDLQARWSHRNDQTVTLSYQDRKSLEEGKDKFKKEVYQEDIDQLIQSVQQKEQWKEVIKNNELIINHKDYTPLILAMFSVIMLIIGIVMIVIKQTLIGAILICIAIGIFAAGILLKNKNHKQVSKAKRTNLKLQEQVNQIEDKVQNYFLSYNEQYDSINTAMALKNLYSKYITYIELVKFTQADEANLSLQNNLEKEVRTIFIQYNLQFNEESVYDDLAKLKQRYMDYLSYVSKNNNEDLKKNKRIYDEAKTVIQRFFSQYHLDVDENNYIKVYLSLNDQKKEMDALDLKVDNQLKAKSKLNEIEDQIRKFISTYKELTADPLDQQLDDMQNQMIAYDKNEKIYQKYYQDKMRFEQTHANYLEIEAFEYQGELIDIDQLIQDKDDLIDQINNEQMKLNDQYTIFDDLTDKKGRIIYLKEENEELNQQYHLLKDTLNYLTKAKEALDTKYRGPLENALKGYLDILEAHTELKITVDVNKKMSFKEGGHPCEYYQLSQGYRDLVDLCFRFALVDAMYKEEKPMLILDDPLINLDDIKVKNGLELLRDLSNRYQILYLTCHTSRKEK